MNAMPLTPELYNELREENYKYLVYKRTLENKDQGVYVPVKELPNHFVISLNSMDDEQVIAALSEKRIFIDY